MNACCDAGSNPTTPRWVRRVREISAWVLPSAILVLVPRCPVCLAAYVALWTGISLSLATATYLRWVLLFLCVASLCLLVVNRLNRLRAVFFKKGDRTMQHQIVSQGPRLHRPPGLPGPA
jgi:predicted transporter